MSRASLDKKPREVASMFDEVARRYDLTNDVMTAGVHRQWRRATVAAVGAQPGERLLDIGAGTGFSSEPYHDREIDVVPADFSYGMLAEGRRRRPDMPFTAADATQLPFADDSFDAVVTSYAIRNVVDPQAAFREFRRVVRPGGRLVVLEFSTPTSTALRTAYERGALRVLPAVARRTASDPESYVYLAESILAWPDQAGVAAMLREAGWRAVEWRNLTGGIAAVHRARA